MIWGKGQWQALHDAAQQPGVARGLTDTAVPELILDRITTAGLGVKRQDNGDDEKLRCQAAVRAQTGIPMCAAQAVEGVTARWASSNLNADNAMAIINTPTIAR